MKNALSLAALALLALAATTSVNAQESKWHPGHYVTLDTGGSQSYHFRNIDEISKEPSIKGVEILIWWYELEPSKGVYDFSQINAYLTKLKSLSTPKRLVVRVMDVRVNTTSKAGIVPNYLMSDAIYKGGVVLRSGPGYVARVWEAPVMDRLIALYRALGARYDSDPYLEGFANEETALGLGSDKSKWPVGYSPVAQLTQHLRFVSAWRQFMPHTNLFFHMNWLGNDLQMSTLVQGVFEEPVAACGVDIRPDKITQAQRIWTGQTGADYRGSLAIANAIESSELGGPLGSYTPKQLYTFAYNTLHTSHLFWVRNTWQGNAAQKWSTGILPFLRTNPPLRTACPSSYGLCSSK